MAQGPQGGDLPLLCKNREYCKRSAAGGLAWGCEQKLGIFIMQEHAQETHSGIELCLETIFSKCTRDLPCHWADPLCHKGSEK